MRQLSVLGVVREAYVFTFVHLGAIIGVIWLPMVIITIAGFFATQHYAAEVTRAVVAGNPAAAGPAMLALLFYGLAKLAFTAMMYVPVAQLALGQRQGGAMVHFVFGALEWRLFRAMFGLILFLLPPALLMVAVGQNVMAGDIAGNALQTLAAELLFLLLYGALVVVMVRIGGLLVPVAVAETAPALTRSWTLSSGNFWRLLAVVVMAAGPLLLTTLAIEAALTQGSGATDAMTQMNMDVGPNLPLVSGLEFLMAPFLIGLVVSASVFSWRALSRTDISI